MTINSSDFRVKQSQQVDLQKWPTAVPAVYESSKHYHDLLDEHVKNLSAQQQLLYAANSHALLIIFQGMDAAGKDGTIRDVMSGINPQGCQVYSSKKPTEAELQHDFLWRTTRNLPERGKIGIFNRSYYEEVLIARVHPEILKGEGVPPSEADKNKFWQNRFRSINHLEQHLSDNGTRIIKFFLHMSKEEQRKRFLVRIDDPRKNWKFTAADIEERKYWDDYMKAYGECLSATSTAYAPWHIVPADDKKNSRLIVSQILLDAIQELKLTYPESDETRQKGLQAIRASLVG